MTNLGKFKLFIVVLSLSCLTGCYSMSRQEVIAAVNECKSAKMEAIILRNPYGLSIVDVQCSVEGGE